MQEDANLICCSELSALSQEAEQEIYKPACLWHLFPIAQSVQPSSQRAVDATIKPVRRTAKLSAQG